MTPRRVLRALALGLAVLAVLAACFSARPQSSARRPAHPVPVPALPPDGWLDPAALDQVFAEANIVRNDARLAGTYPRDLIHLWFQPTATQAERQAAVDAVGGWVVGGARTGAQGVYYVRIEHDGTANRLHDAIAKLEALPQVRLATPDLSLVWSPRER